MVNIKLLGLADFDFLNDVAEDVFDNPIVMSSAQ